MVVIFVQSAVLRDLGPAGKDHSSVGLEDDIRCPRITVWRIPFIDERLSGQDLLNAQGCLILRSTQRSYCSRHQGGIGQPNQRTVIGDVESFCRSENSIRPVGNAHPFAEIDR